MHALQCMLSFDQNICGNKEKQLDCKFRLCFEIAKICQKAVLNQPVFSDTLRVTGR